MMHRGWSSALSACLLLLTSISAGAAAPAPSAGSGIATDVRVEHGRLSVNLQDARLADVLRIIGQRAGVPVVLRGQVTASVTQSFEDLSLDEGIQRLARGYSVAFLYQASGNPAEPTVSRVWVIGAALERQPNVTQGHVPPIVVTEGGVPVSSSQNAQRVGDKRAGTREGSPELDNADANRQKRAATDRIRTLQDRVRTEGVGAARGLQEVMASDTEPRVRLAAAEALASMRTDEARQALESATSDPDESVRRVVDRALARWRHISR